MKTRVNLYLLHLRPVKEILPFSQFISLGITTVVLMILTIAGLSYINSSISSDNMQLTNDLRTKQSMLSDKASELATLTTNSPLIQKIERVKLKINEKKKVLATLNDEIKGNSGYSHLFSGLADIKMNNVWLTHIATRNGQLNFGGRALSSKDIPIWVNALESSQALNGQTFSTLSIKREDNIVSFSLSNNSEFIVEDVK